MNSADELSEWLSLWGNIHAHKKDRGKGRGSWVVNFYYPLDDDQETKIFSAASFELFLALQSIISDLREFWDKEGDYVFDGRETMKLGAAIPGDMKGRLQWLYESGSVTITRDNHAYDRNAPWLVKVEIAKMAEAWIEKEGQDIYQVLGETIKGVREFWANFNKDRKIE